MSHKKIRIGLVGCGARLRSVVKNLLATPESSQLDIVALYDPSPASIEITRRELAPAASVYETLEELLVSDGVDWVMIGSWNCFHASQIIAALKAGKHIFAEKPLATTLEDCLQIREALEAAGDRAFFFGLVLRYAPIYQKLQELLGEGVIGRPISLEFNETLDFNHGGYIHGNWRRHREHAGTHLLEKCCHDFDIVNWLLGSVPVRAASFGGRDVFGPANRELPLRLQASKTGQRPYQAWVDPDRVDPFSDGATIVDNQVAILEYASGVRATFHTNCHAALPERRILILGTEGAIRMDAASGTIEWQRIGFDEERKEFRLSSEGGHFGADRVMAEHLAQSMVSQAQPLASLAEGLRATVACLGVDAALDQGCIVDLHPLWQQAGVELSTSH